MAKSLFPSDMLKSGSGEMRVYTGSAWVAAYVSGTGFLSSANNLSDLASFSTARTNLGLVASATTDTTNASNISSGTLGAARLPAFTGDATSSAGSSALTLATVNSTTGTFGSSSSIPVVTVNGKGLVTSVTTSAVAGGQYFGSAATKAIAYNSTTIAENITTTSGNNLFLLDLHGLTPLKNMVFGMIFQDPLIQSTFKIKFFKLLLYLYLKKTVSLVLNS